MKINYSPPKVPDEDNYSLRPACIVPQTKAEGLDQLAFVWDDSYQLGIPVLDEQHRTIASNLNSLSYLIRVGRSESIIEATLNTLDQCMRIHFSTEEEILEAAAFPGLKEHRAAHQAFSRQIQDRLASGSGTTTADGILRFLIDWWPRHITSEDRAFVAHLTQGKESWE